MTSAARPWWRTVLRLPYDLLFRWTHFPALCCLVLLGEAVLGTIIIHRVPYTEIDWVAYMGEVEGFLRGQLDYAHLKGTTGPLPYPAGFLYLFAGLRYLGGGDGTSIVTVQWIFLALYLASLVICLVLYGRVAADLRKQAVQRGFHSFSFPPCLVLLLCASKRLHSLYMLRLFNECWATFFLLLAMLLFMQNRWGWGCAVFSVGVSVKMNVLLAAPGLFVLLCLRFAPGPGELVTYTLAAEAELNRIRAEDLPRPPSFPSSSDTSTSEAHGTLRRRNPRHSTADTASQPQPAVSAAARPCTGLCQGVFYCLAPPRSSLVSRCWPVVKHLAICAAVQLLLGAPFLATYPHSYMTRAFNFSRKFFRKWSVNGQHVPIDVFTSGWYGMCMLAGLVVCMFWLLGRVGAAWKTHPLADVTQAQTRVATTTTSTTTTSTSNSTATTTTTTTTDTTTTTTTTDTTTTANAAPNTWWVLAEWYFFGRVCSQLPADLALVPTEVPTEVVSESTSISTNTTTNNTTSSSTSTSPATTSTTGMQKRSAGQGIVDVSPAVAGTFAQVVSLQNLPPTAVAVYIWLSNFVGVCFSRSLHYQFYAWYAHSLPMLCAMLALPAAHTTTRVQPRSANTTGTCAEERLEEGQWSFSGLARWVVRVAAFLAVDAVWAAYPPSVWGSVVLNAVHAALLLEVGFSAPLF